MAVLGNDWGDGAYSGGTAEVATMHTKAVTAMIGVRIRAKRAVTEAVS